MGKHARMAIMAKYGKPGPLAFLKTELRHYLTELSEVLERPMKPSVGPSRPERLRRFWDHLKRISC